VTRPPAPLPGAAAVRTPPPPFPRAACVRGAQRVSLADEGKAGLRTRAAARARFRGARLSGAPLAGSGDFYFHRHQRTDRAESIATDAEGRARVGVTLGERMGRRRARGRGRRREAGRIQRAAGAVSQLVVTCGATALSSRVVLRPDTIAVLRVTARDEYGQRGATHRPPSAVADARILSRAADRGGQRAGRSRSSPIKRGRRASP